MVYKFLNLFLGINAAFQVPLGVDVQEGGGAAQGHGGAVLLLNRRQISEIKPLNGFLGVLGRLRDIIAVAFRHTF